MKGLVIKSTGSWYDLKLDSGEMVEARLRGKIRLKGLKTSNPIAVGDNVEVEVQNEEYIISDILPRQNYIVRQSIQKAHHGQILCANVDQAVLFVTIKNPITSKGFIDRFLVSTECFRIPAVLVFNKTDLISKDELEQLEEIFEIYAPIYPCIHASLTKDEGVEEISKLMANKVNVVAGHSGTGKSTLLNKLNPSLDRKIGDISEVHLKGKHTTTFAEMLEVSPGTYVIDSPGIQELNLFEVDLNVLSHYFVEMRERINDCKFNDCRHVNEPGCAVLEALEEGEIHPERYYNYLNLLEENDFKSK